MASLVELSELQRRLDFDLDSVQERVALAALEDLSDEAIYLGSAGWTPYNVPSGVKIIILRAAVRYARNPEGYLQSRAGDELVAWEEGSQTGAATFTEDEESRIKALARRKGVGGLVSLQVHAWPRKDRPVDLGWVPVAGGGSPMPFFVGFDQDDLGERGPFTRPNITADTGQGPGGR